MNDDSRPARLVLRNVRCFRHAVVELDPGLTVLIGENGSGKTTIVEALASLSSGQGEGLAAFPLARKARSGEIALYGDGSRRPLARWRSGSTSADAGRRLPESRFLLAYGRYRRVFYPEDATSEPAPFRPELELDALARRAFERRTTTVFRPDNHLLRDLSRYLAILHFAAESDDRLKVVWRRLSDSLAGLGHGIEGIVMERGRSRYVPRIVRSGIPLELRELSDGYQAILVVIFDLVLRYAYLFPTLEDPLLGEATVVVDEVDLHLHPRWQRTVAGQLRELFPNTQLILTTHSPAVVQGAIDFGWSVVSLEDDGGAAVAKRLSPEQVRALRGAEVGSVLQEEKLFGVDSRYSPRFSEVEERVARVQEKMSRGTAGDEDRRQLFADMDTLQRLMAADEQRRADGSFMARTAELRIAFLKDLAAEIERARQ